MIGQETLDRVRRETAIVELIGETVRLQKRGRSYVGLCPFHKEKTPSFHVNPERGFFYCFGCHASGDAIGFLQKTEGVDFTEAVRALAERAGIPVVEQTSAAEQRENAESRRRQNDLFAINQFAASFFERMLREHPLRNLAHAELARRALVSDSPTGLVADTLQGFRIGYAPYGWDALGHAVRDAGMSTIAAEKLGLLVPRRTGTGYYDRFRHRLMFAVNDLQGRVIAFSGRALPDPQPADLQGLGIEYQLPNAEAPAKYLNSPESPIYRKRDAVFGLHQARSSLHSGAPCVVVEGNFDVVTLHAHGIKNVVAPLGTAFTLEQAQLIRKFTSDVILFFDGDTAGRRATRTARDICKQTRLTTKVAVLPQGIDPDELVRKKGADAIQGALGTARGMLEYLMDVILDDGFTLLDAQSRATKIREVGELLASEDDPTARALAERHADRIAERLGIADAKTFGALDAAIRRALAPKQAAPGPGIEPPHRARSRARHTEIAYEILGVFLDFPQLLSEETCTNAAGAVLEGEAASMFASMRHNWTIAPIAPEQLLAKLAPSIHAFAFARLAVPRHERVDDARSELLENVKKLSALELSRQKAATVGELERAAQVGDFEQQTNLLRELEAKARKARGVSGIER